MKLWRFAAAWLCVLTAGATVLSAEAGERKLNLVFILCDNLSPWPIGCYGNKEILTPNIDRLAAEGMRFTRAYSVNGVCSPTRATFLTGLIPSQHGIHSFFQPEKANPECAIREFESLPKILAGAGYTCGLSGKWHLGGALAGPQEGFSYWFTKNPGSTETFYGDEMIWQGKLYREPKYTTDAITDHAIEFLEQSHGKPFFLYLAYNAPYGLGRIMREVHQNRHTDYYAGKNMDSFPREPISLWLMHNRDFMNNLVSMRSYAAAMSGLDDGVGRVMETLRRLGHDRDTLVVFTADQGLAGGHGGYWGMGDHTRPLAAREPAVMIPLIWRQPGAIPRGTACDLMTSNYDFLPTVLAQMGLKAKTPDKTALPGRNYARTLTGEKLTWENVIFHDFENLRMVRTEDRKLIVRYPNGPDELYDMKKDPGERENLIHWPEHAAMKKQLQKQLDGFFARYADPQYDLWRGGRSKAKRLTK
ncbi:MAG: sulfatase-like hydrolase/transferase [Verrucomicrobiia bacterium]